MNLRKLALAVALVTTLVATPATVSAASTGPKFKSVVVWIAKRNLADWIIRKTVFRGYNCPLNAWTCAREAR